MAMTSHSDVHVQVNVYLNLPIVRKGITAIGEEICKTINREHGRENYEYKRHNDQ